MDPFASLDPLCKPKTHAERIVNSATNGMHLAQVSGHPSPTYNQVQPVPSYHPAMQGMQAGYMPYPPGGMQHASMMGVSANTQQAQPIMYDNIRNLLQQKPKANFEKDSNNFGDPAGLDFLESLGTVKQGHVSATSPVSSAEITGDFQPHESRSQAVAKSDGTALSDRLAKNRRTTQEAQRSKLQVNANAFTNSTGSPKISLKGLASNPSEPTVKVMAFDEFAAGTSQDTANGNKDGATEVSLLW